MTWKRPEITGQTMDGWMGAGCLFFSSGWMAEWHAKVNKQFAGLVSDIWVRIFLLGGGWVGGGERGRKGELCPRSPGSHILLDVSLSLWMACVGACKVFLKDDWYDLECSQGRRHPLPSIRSWICRPGASHKRRRNEAEIDLRARARLQPVRPGKSLVGSGRAWKVWQQPRAGHQAATTQPPTTH